MGSPFKLYGTLKQENNSLARVFLSQKIRSVQWRSELKSESQTWLGIRECELESNLFGREPGAESH